MSATEIKIPRRINMAEWTDAEKAIQNAVNEVEKVGADIRLTNIVVMLGEARSLLADYVDDTLKNLS